MILCGWCGAQTANRDRCSHCGHEDPERPWRQRGEPTPVVSDRQDRAAIAKRLAEARHALTTSGRKATVEALAEQMDVSPRTVRRWRDLTA